MTLVVVLAGCGGTAGKSGSPSPRVMPNVVGLQLDVALRDIASAGFTDEVAISGGGTFGVVNKANWAVCEQSPAAGNALIGPKLTVDRKCVGTRSETSSLPNQSSPVTTTTAAGTSVLATVPTSPSFKVLTVRNSPELAAILVEGDYCADSIRAFTSSFKGRNIEFDGHIADVRPNAKHATRWDFLLAVGDGPDVVGPAFKFEDVGRVDLHLIDESIPSLGMGDRLHVVATVRDYNPDQCLLFLDPVSTGLR